MFLSVGRKHRTRIANHSHCNATLKKDDLVVLRGNEQACVVARQRLQVISQSVHELNFAARAPEWTRRTVPSAIFTATHRLRLP